MVKDEKIRLIRRESGKKGGNPHLLVNHIVNQNTNHGVIHFTEDENEDENENVVIGKGVQGKRKTQLPDDFSPDAEMIEWAKSIGVTDPLSVTFQFIDHHKARGTLFKDWVAGWRTWMRNDIKFRSKNQMGGAYGKVKSGNESGGAARAWARSRGVVGDADQSVTVKAHVFEGDGSSGRVMSETDSEKR